MRPLEMILTSMLILCWGSYVWPVNRRPRWLMVLPGITGVMALVQLIVEHYRWQMVPAYALAIVFCVVNVPRLLGKKIALPAGLGRKIVNGIGLVLSLAVIVIAAALPVLFPVFQMPNPTGQYAVGTTSFVFTDESRPEIFTPDPEDTRQVYVQVWYPAQSMADVQPVPVWVDPQKITPVLAKDFGMPEFLFSHFPLIASHSYRDTPLAELETTYPVLVFSHGYTPGFFAQNMVQMEELASHGYIIFSVGHAYESGVVLDAEGQVVLPSETPLAFTEEFPESLAQVYYYVGEKQRQFARAFLAASPLEQRSIQVWTQDMQFVLTQIERMNLGQVQNAFTGHLDTSRIGVFGQSFGGATAFQVCAVDSRCKATVNLDGGQYGTLLDDPLQAPFLMMYGKFSDGINDWALSHSPETGYSIRVNDTTHINFTDFNLVSPVFKLPFYRTLGDIDSRQMERIMNAYTLAFFDQTLKNTPSPLFEGLTIDYPEIELRIISPTSE